ncbi:CHAT domain-containing protein [Streptosporangium sp. NPDC002524]|uniref:CHAT domain-containing protein n=1 Tax=Streptosporangium sp. NPDC002524 TaxID=3154537 RepID=UPI0033213A5A
MLHRQKVRYGHTELSGRTIMMLDSRDDVQEKRVSEKQYRDQIDRYTKELAALRKDEAAAKTAAGKARASAATSRAKIKPTTSASMARSYESAAQRADKQAAGSEKKAADLAGKIADRTKKLHTAESGLARVQRATTRRDDQASAKQRRVELDHARKVAQLSRPVVRHVHEIRSVPTPQIEELRLLYLTANPDSDLRVDAEVAQVQRAVRGALHRDSVKINHRPAAAPEDLLDGLNDLKPHVVHFSGHGGAGAIVMDNSNVDDPQARDLTFDRLGRALDTAAPPPVLLVLNACDTVEGADEDLLPIVPVVIAMASTVLDATAAVFAARFYAAIAAGISIKKAFDQAVLGVELAGLSDESWMITLVHREDVDPADTVLVRLPVDTLMS